MTASSAPHAPSRRSRALAAWSIVVAFAVLALKFVAWKMTGSVALYSDALESIVNVIAAGAALWAIQVSHKPADQDHPFGHHKAEYFSAVLEGVLIGIAALLIIMEVGAQLARRRRARSALDRPRRSTASRRLINAVWAFVAHPHRPAARSRRRWSPTAATS